MAFLSTQSIDYFEPLGLVRNASFVSLSLSLLSCLKSVDSKPTQNGAFLKPKAISKYLLIPIRLTETGIDC
jgi:hypothetical protein